MDRKVVSALAAIGAISAPLMGQIQLTENLTVTGFIDMSASKVEADESYFGPDQDVTAGLDQFELDFIYTYDKLTAQADVNYLDYNDDGDEAVELEQAFITYSLTEQVSITAGKYLSYLGWESAEPTGLYQFSYAYDAAPALIIPGYNNGVKIDFTMDSVSFGVSLQDDLYGESASKTIDTDDYAFEIYGKYSNGGLTLFAAYAVDQDTFGGDDQLSVINLWASYEVGSALFAIEYNFIDEYDFEGQAGLLMVNYGFTDKFGITGRVSMENWDGKAFDNVKYTVSPGYAVTDNLFILAEVSYTDWELSGVDGTTAYAIEAIFTF